MTYSSKRDNLVGRESESSEPERKDDKPLLGKRILIVEDEVLLAMDIQYSLEEAGADVVGPGHTVEEADELLSQGPLDLAILDVDLNGRDVFPIAEKLDRQGIPFVFHTGHATREQLKSLFPDIIVCHKPMLHSDLVKLLKTFD